MKYALGTALNSVQQSFNRLDSGTRALLFRWTLIRALLSFLDFIAVFLVATIVAIGSNAQVNSFALVILKSMFPAGWLTTAGLWNLVAIAVVLFILKTALSTLTFHRTLRILANAEKSVGDAATRGILGLGISRLRQIETADVSYCLSHGVNAATVRLLGSAIVVISESSQILVLGTLLVLMEPLSGAVALLLFGVLLGLTLKILGAQIHHSGVIYADSTVCQMSHVREFIETYREVWVSGRQEYFLDRISVDRRTAADASARMNFLVNSPRFFFELLLILTALAIGWIQFHFYDSDKAFVSIATFLVGGSRILPSMLSLQGALGLVRQSSAESLRLHNLVEEAGNDVYPYGIDRSVLSVDEIKPFFVNINDLSVTHDGQSSPTLEAISMSVPAGAKYAIVGASGAGKSTLVDSLLGITEPSQGSISVSGYTPIQLIREHPGCIGYVPQTVSILSASLAQNVALGIPPSEINRLKVKECLESAQLSDFLGALRDGLDTLLGEGGSTISGGQRQRIGIARALYTSPGLLVLDEPTSALDPITEKQLMDLLDTLSHRTTLIVVTHRASTIGNSDRLLELSDGRGTEQILRN